MVKVWIFADLSLPDAALSIFLLQVAVTLLLTRLCSRLLAFFKQPSVIGEMVGGIILGPSVLGRLPGYTEFLWPKWSLPTFTVAANIGLILFMFALGVELDTRALKGISRLAIPLSLSGIAVPFGVGIAMSHWLYDYNAATAENHSSVAFMLFAGVSLSFTAFPVLAAILKSAGLLHTHLATLTLAAASFGDVLGWCVLATCASFASGDPSEGGYVFLAAFFLTFTIVVIVRPTFHIMMAIASENGRVVSSQIIDLFFITLAIVCSFAYEVIGVHAFFGSFIAGVIVPKGDHPAAITTVTLPERLELVSRGFLLPLFFASSGIKTDIGSLSHGKDWLYFFVILAIAILVKFIPSCLVAKLLSKKDWRFAVTVGILMNTRGLVELIALNVGLQTGVLGVQLFTILVLMAIVTTCMTSPLLHFVYTTRARIETPPTRPTNPHSPNTLDLAVARDEPHESELKQRPVQHSIEIVENAAL